MLSLRPHDFVPQRTTAEYEALWQAWIWRPLWGLKQLLVHSDSRLVAHQINGEYEAKEQKIAQYLDLVKKRKGVQLENKSEASNTTNSSGSVTLVDGVLYKRGYSVPLLRLSETDADYALREVHEGICGNHAGGQTLAYKLIRQGYYWPYLRKDATDLVKRCERCQRFAQAVRYNPEQLTSVFSPWPFAKWGMDLIGPLPTGKGGVNGKQFDNRRFRNFCEGFHIKNYFSTPYHPQSNGQVEAVNKILKYTLKARLEESKGNWPEELPGVLWSYRMTHLAATGETPFSLAYGAEAVIPVEIGAPTFRIANFEENCNEAALRTELDLLEEKRCSVEMKNAVYKQRSERYYNSKVKERRFQVGDLVLKKITGVQPNPLKPTWEGPFRVSHVLSGGAYQLEYLSGEKFMHPWNVAYLKRYYQ
ncbi:hypothetical protein DH2020_044099 [Rehmannia glutinosa]|uniref:Integrase catalytic domain-containing protein n=1 Tax=Rehmannia glutinosa TaxID=99300 RepID=A0ABR0UHW0_REHGL